MKAPQKTGILAPDERNAAVVAVRALLDGSHVGILSTVDSQGIPRARFMATGTFRDFPRVYSLTAPDSRKIDDIDCHPIVNWMFFSPDMSFVVNLIGSARVFLGDIRTMKRIWREVEDKSHAYFLGGAPGMGFTVIQTQVEIIECTRPLGMQKFSLEPEEVASRWHDAEAAVSQEISP